jgi:hypothetical protein
MGLRGPKPKGAAHAMMKGYYRPSRHGPRPPPPEDPEAAYIREAWAELRLLHGPRPSHPLDPIEELLQREGIEIMDEDPRQGGPGDEA